MQCRFLVLFLLVTAFAFCSGPARAATSFFWTNTVSSGWSVAGNWTNDLATVAAPDAAGQTNYILNFHRAATYTATN